MRQTLITFAAVYAVVLGAASCNSSSNAPMVAPGQYQQIERLARPAVKELFQAFANHDGTNRTSPAALHSSLMRLKRPAVGASALSRESRAQPSVSGTALLRSP